MIIEIKASTLSNTTITTYMVAKDINSATKKVDLIKDKIDAVLVELKLCDHDFCDSLTFTKAALRRRPFGINFDGNAITGQVLKGNYKLIDLK
jgi:hypothetical protein